MTHDIYDIIGVGFGPSNLALAVAIKEEKELNNSNVRSLFLEKKAGFSWHEDMQFDDVTIQTSFLKDLVTLNNPQSYYSFLNYLKTQDRLYDFLNLKTFFPSRYEFAQYFKWVASYLEDMVEYGSEVQMIELIETEKLYKITISNNQETMIYYAKNIVIAAGLEKNLTEFSNLDNKRVIHSNKFKKGIKELGIKKNDHNTFFVVGAGQSSGEITKYLLNNYECKVTVASRGYVYKAIDDNPFVNKLYSIKGAEWNYLQTKEGKEKILEDLALTNYSVIDNNLAQELHHIMYQDKVHGRKRLILKSFCELTDLQESQEEVKLVMKSKLNGEFCEYKADFVILATGFSQRNLFELLNDIQSYIVKSENQLIINKDYSLTLINDDLPKIYVQGYGDYTHGVSEGTLTVLSERSNIILKSILETKPVLV